MDGTYISTFTRSWDDAKHLVCLKWSGILISLIKMTGEFSDSVWFVAKFDGKIRLETDLNIYSTSQIAVVNK